MADRVQYLGYDVYLATKDEAERYQLAYPNGVNVAPTTMASQTGFPVVPYSDTTPFVAPCIRSPFFSQSTKYPLSVASFTKCRGAWFGICALFGRVTTYHWIAKFHYAAPAVATINDVAVVAPEDIQQLSWMEGFEVGGDEGFAGNMPITRAASRHADGYGLAFRSHEAAGKFVSIAANANGAALRVGSWERLYMRPRNLPDISTAFWRCRGTTSNEAGIMLELTPGLQIVAYNVRNDGVRTLVGTTSVPLDLPVWHKVDILLEYGPVGRLRLYVKGVLRLDVTVAVGVGLGQNQNHGFTDLGGAFTVANTCEIDFDDWTCAPIPPAFDGLDWLNGTKIVAVSPVAFNAGNTFGAGDVRSLLHNPAVSATGFTAGGAVSSAVSGALLIVDTDAEFTIDKVEGSLGCIGIRVDATRAIAGGAQTGQLGYSIAGAAAVMAAVAESSIYDRDTAYYRPSGMTVPAPVTPLTLHYTKAPNVNACTVYRLMAEAALLGVFGDEDIKVEAAGDAAANVPPRFGPHNAPYPRSIWARQAVPPTAPVIIIGGTYVGNDVGQDLQFRAPVNWFISRTVSGGSPFSVRWWSSLTAAHAGENQGIQFGMEGLIQAAEDTTFVPVGGDNDPEERYLLKITGNGANNNAAGVTYQYIAVIDPGARFMLNGVEMHHSAVLNAVNLLKNLAFLPQGMYVVHENVTASGATEHGFKGPGNAATGVSVMSDGELLNYLTFGTGQFTTHAANGHIPDGTALGYNAWRTDDGSGDVGVPKVVKVGSYIGNGTASRTVTLAPTSGMRPLFVEVIPGDATPAIRRDPSHTGTTSSTSAGAANAATGIVSGGIDEFTVGSALNTTGVVYNYFVLMGGDTACNNGWSCNGEFVPVEPEYGVDFPAPADGPFVVDPGEEEGGLPDPDPGPGDDEDCDAGEVCVTATTSQVNLSLLEIGVSQTLTNYCTQSTREAIIAQLLYETSVRQTLVATPWPFATRYAALVLTGAQPNHADWTYSYRVPVDCVFPRRLVVSRGTGVDPEPPAFMLSSDASGGLLFSNQPAAVLEYTCRPDCVAFNGDDLFLEALKWHLAAALAPPLTRMTAEADRCTKMFHLTIEKANAIRKPGVPGLRTAADPLSPDAAAACITANIQVVNRGLLRIGCQTIANLATDQSRPAVAANLILEDELRATLQDYPWKFAKRYNAALAVVGGSSTVSANPDWQYSYRLPDDYVMVRRLVAEGTGRKFEDSPPPWEVGTDATGNLLFTDVESDNLSLEYTARIPCAVAKASDLFRDALAWRIAAALAPSLAQVDPTHPEQLGRGPDAPTDPRQRISHKPSQANLRAQATRYAQTMYRLTLERARIQDANEAEPEDEPDAEWIRDRG